MANVFNKHSRLNTLTVADLVSTAPIQVRKVRFKPTGETQTAVFHTCDIGASPDCNAYLTGATVASTSIITAGSGTPFDGAATGDWLEISGCNTADDDGWYFIKTYSSTTSVTVEKGINALTDGSGTVNMHIKIWSPAEAMLLVADDYGVTVNTVTDELDWGDRGRWFNNLALYSITAGSVDLYYM